MSSAFPEIRAVAARRARAWDGVQAKKRAVWAKLSPAQREQLISTLMTQNMAATRTNISAISAMQMSQHATNMNIINNSRSSSGPIDYYYTR